MPRTAPPSPHPAARQTLLARLRRGSGMAAGWVLVVAGAIVTPTPIPFGLPMVAVGLYLVARDSEAVRSVVRGLRRRVPLLSRGLNRLRGRVPAAVARVIEATDPNAPAPPVVCDTLSP